MSPALRLWGAQILAIVRRTASTDVAISRPVAGGDTLIEGLRRTASEFDVLALDMPGSAAHVRV